MPRHWRIWQDEDNQPVQWKTREPVRPPLREDGEEGWLLSRLTREERDDWPTLADWVAGAAFGLVVLLLWLLAAGLS